MSHTPLAQAELDELAKTWEGSEKVNRLGLVIYQSTQYTQRTSPICVTPETRFGNHGTLSSSMTRSKNYADDGKHILGDEDDAANRLGRELLMQLYNGLSAAGLHLNTHLNDLLTQILYVDSSTGRRKALQSLPFDPQNPEQAVAVQQYRRYYCWLYGMCQSILLGVRRATYRANIEKVKAATAVGQKSGFNLGERVPVATAVQPSPKAALPVDDIGAGQVQASSPVVVKILRRRLHGTEASFPFPSGSYLDSTF